MRDEDQGGAVRQMESDQYVWNELMNLRMDINILCDRQLVRKDITLIVSGVTPEESVAIYQVRQFMARFLEQDK